MSRPRNTFERDPEHDKAVTARLEAKRQKMLEEWRKELDKPLVVKPSPERSIRHLEWVKSRLLLDTLDVRTVDERPMTLHPDEAERTERVKEEQWVDRLIEEVAEVARKDDAFRSQLFAFVTDRTDLVCPASLVAAAIGELMPQEVEERLTQMLIGAFHDSKPAEPVIMALSGVMTRPRVQRTFQRLFRAIAPHLRMRFKHSCETLANELTSVAVRSETFRRFLEEECARTTDCDDPQKSYSPPPLLVEVCELAQELVANRLQRSEMRKPLPHTVLLARRYGTYRGERVPEFAVPTPEQEGKPRPNQDDHKGLVRWSPPERAAAGTWEVNRNGEIIPGTFVPSPEYVSWHKYTRFASPRRWYYECLDEAQEALEKR